MAEIEIEERGDGDWEVTVREGGSETRHRVTVPEADRVRLGGEADADELLEESFRFLLEREPKESILRSFEISVISRYFPEYPDEIRRRLGSGGS